VPKRHTLVAELLIARRIMKLARQVAEVDGLYWKVGGRYRIRTYDFHRVKVALYR
jgi:hypothetical protein